MMKIKTPEQDRKIRWLFFLCGSVILSFGLTFNTKSNLGIAAVNSFPYLLSVLMGISLGNAVRYLYIGLILVQILLKRKADLKTLLQFPFSFAFGWLLDGADFVLHFQAQSLPLQILCMILGIVFTALGAFLMLQADVVLNPADGMVQCAAQVFHKEKGLCKNILDLSMVLLTIVVSWTCAHRIIGIGIGTICSALFIGRLLSLYTAIYKRITRPVSDSDPSLLGQPEGQITPDAK